MKDLPIQFMGKGEVRGFLFKQLKKSSKAFIYEVTTFNCKHYEVLKKQINKRFNCITYPGAASFGIIGWAYKSYEKAIAKFNELNSDN